MGVVNQIQGYQQQLTNLDNLSKLTWALSNGAIPFIAGTALASGWVGKAVNIGDAQCGWLRSFAKGCLAVVHAKQTHQQIKRGEYRMALFTGSLAAFESLFVAGHLFKLTDALKPMDWASEASRRSFQSAIKLTPVIYLSLAADICLRGEAHRTNALKEQNRTLRHDAIFLAFDVLGTGGLYWGWDLAQPLASFSKPLGAAVPWACTAVAAATELHRSGMMTWNRAHEV